MKLKLTGKELRAVGYPEGPVISVAMKVMEKNFKHDTKEHAFEVLNAVLSSTAEYLNDTVLSPIARMLMPKKEMEGAEISLKNSGVHFNIFGSEHIEQGAMQQMHTAARLPVAVAGAL